MRIVVLGSAAGGGFPQWNCRCAVCDLFWSGDPEPVARGERLAVVGWVRSVVRDAEAREMLFDLDQAVAAARTPDGASRVLDLLLKTRANLLRRWAE